MVWCFDGEGTYNPSLWVDGLGSMRVIQMDFPAGKFTKIVFGRMYDNARDGAHSALADFDESLEYS
jgi:hypothetical protein